MDQEINDEWEFVDEPEESDWEFVDDSPEQKTREAASIYHAEEKTAEDLKNMTLQERMQYAEDLKTEREYLQSKGFTKGALSGATFGATENIEALKPQEGELGGTFGQTVGSFLPISKLFNFFGGALTKLAQKSPILQKQLSAFANLLGAGATGATVKGLESVAKGEIPEAEDLLEHGVEWAALDAVLQTLGLGGRFAANLLRRSKETGASRRELINRVNKQIEELGLTGADPEVISAKAFEILEQPIESTARKLELPEKAETAIESLGKETLQKEKVTPNQLLTGRVKETPFNKLDEEIVVLSEPYQPEQINFSKEVRNLEESGIASKIESSGERAATEQELGNLVREDINSQLKKDKAGYKPLYKEAEQVADVSMHIPQKTAKVAGQALIDIAAVKTKPEGYSKVIGTLETILEDAGFKIERDEANRITQIISTQDVPVSKTIELAKRLNEIVDYAAIEPSVKDKLKTVVRAAKQDIRDGLRATNEDALAAFELAEEEYARVAKKYGKKSIKNIRKTEAGEKITKVIDNPTELGDLAEILTPKQRKQVEREILENLNKKTYEQSKKQLREIKKHLTEENAKLAEQIVESKNPYNPKAKNKLVQESIIEDMSDALTTGSRPDKTLKLWKTEKGQKLVKDAFKGSENWNQVKNYLEKQSFSDIASTVIKDGKLDIKKFDKLMNDPAALNNIRSQGGEEAVQFFKQMDSKVKQFQENTKLLDKFVKESDVKRGKELLKKAKEKNLQKPNIPEVGEEALRKQSQLAKETKGVKGKKILERMASKDFPIQKGLKKFQDVFKDTIGISEKGALSVFGLMKLGIPNTVATLIGYRLLSKMLTNPRVRKAFTEASRKGIDSLTFLIALESLGDEAD